MEQKVRNEQMKYGVVYIRPEEGGLSYEEEQEIEPNSFDAEIPDGAIGYEVFCEASTRYNSYRVYKGKVISFKEARDMLIGKDSFINITNQMVEKGKKSEELKALFAKNVDLKERFNKFVAECKQMEANSYKHAIFAEEQGIVIIATVNYPHYIYEMDVVVPEN